MFSVSDCAPTESVTVAANVQSGGTAGEPLEILMTLTNSGTSQATFNLNAAGFASWANAADLNPQELTLSPGQSGQVLVTLDVNDDAKGLQTFNLEIMSGSEFIASQPVQVTIDEKAGFFSGITGAATGTGVVVGLLGLITLVLLIIVIVLGIRLSRK